MVRTIHGIKTRTATPSEQAKSLCDAIESRGNYRLPRLALNSDNAEAIDVMTYCASDERNAYLAEDATALQQAFRDIAFKVAQLRLTK